jgi:hypothetical protein
MLPNNGRVYLPMRSKMGTGTVLWLRTRTLQLLFTFSFIRIPPFLRRSYVHLVGCSRFVTYTPFLPTLSPDMPSLDT